MKIEDNITSDIIIISAIYNIIEILIAILAKVISMGGKSAALPDLNTKWIINTKEFLNAIRLHDYPNMFGALYASNAMLPDNYQVKISDSEYQRLVQQDLMVVCSHCKAESKYQDVRIQTTLRTHTLIMLTGNKQQKVWYCSKCNKSNLLSKTHMIQDKLAEPFYLKVVPSPPSRKGNVTDRTQYHMQIEKWAYQFYGELEHQMSLYRIQYKPKGDEVEENEFMEDEEFE